MFSSNYTWAHRNLTNTGSAQFLLSRPCIFKIVIRLLVKNTWTFLLSPIILAFEVGEKKYQLSGASLFRFHPVVVCSLSNSSAGIPRRPFPLGFWVKAGPERSSQEIWKQKWGSSHDSLNEGHYNWKRWQKTQKRQQIPAHSPPLCFQGFRPCWAHWQMAAWGPSPNSHLSLHPWFPPLLPAAKPSSHNSPLTGLCYPLIDPYLISSHERIRLGLFFNYCFFFIVIFKTTISNPKMIYVFHDKTIKQAQLCPMIQLQGLQNFICSLGVVPSPFK